MISRRIQGARFVGGSADTGRLILTREDGSTARCGVVIVQGGPTLTDNEDSTFDLNFDGS